MLVANVLLLNLLIAMFSTTFAKIEMQSEKVQVNSENPNLFYYF